MTIPRLFLLVLAVAALAACDEADAASAITNFGPEIIGAAFAAVTTYAVRFAVNHVWAAGMLGRLLVEAKAAVAEVEQTYIDKITLYREDGMLTVEEAAAARAAAIAALKGNLGSKGLHRLGRILGLNDDEIDRLLGTHVEFAVKAMSQAKPLELVAGQAVATLQPAPAGASSR